MFFLTGVARYLFVPMAEAVVFAMLASYVLSRTLVPTMAKYPAEAAPGGSAREPAQPQSVRAAAARASRSGSSAARRLPGPARAAASAPRRCSPALFLLCCVASFALLPLGRRGFLPGGRRRPVQAAPARADRHAHRGDGDPLRPRRGRAPRDDSAARARPASSTTSACPTAASTSPTAPRRPIGPGDADIMVVAGRATTGRPRTTSTTCGMTLPKQFPGVIFSFVPADIVTQILNFGLPAPIDIQVVGRNLAANRRFAGDAGRRGSRRCPASPTCACTRSSTSRGCTSTSTARAPRRSG